MGKKKVLLVSSGGLGNGGVQNVLMSIVKTFKDQYNFDVLVFVNDNYYDEAFLSFGGKIIRLPRLNSRIIFLKKIDTYVRWLRNYPKIIKILKENGPYAVVHCNNDVESGYILKAAKKCGVPCRISHVHRIVGTLPDYFRRWLFSYWVNQVKKYATDIIGCSKEACEAFVGGDSNYNVILNPYDSEKFTYYCKFPNNLTLIQIGSFCDNKNQLFSLDIVNCLKEKYPNVIFKMVGYDTDEFYLEKIKRRIEELDLINNVSILPHDSDTSKILADSSFFLFPSKCEGFGLVLIEAQAVGVHCYAADTVPLNTNCGGCTYLPLSYGAKKWANIITEDFERTKGAHEKFDCSRFEPLRITDELSSIYERKE